MRILIVATKAPWPPRDGGRLLTFETLKSLKALGHEVHLVAPADAPPPDSASAEAELATFCVPHLIHADWPRRLSALARSVVTGRPYSIVRHARSAVRAAVATELDARAFDVVHAEQLQALEACVPARDRGVPLVLRAQNVESDLWAASSAASGLSAPILRFEAARLRRWEGRALETVNLTLALTDQDTDRLRQLSSGKAQVERLAAPFPAIAPPALETRSGHPCVLLLGSSGWRPNDEASAWFLDNVWPKALERLPDARIHAFGPGAGTLAGLHRHPTPEASRDCFAPNGILVVPLTVASGVRMKILEAWSRGLPVVASPQAARGLDAEDDRDMLLASTPEAFVNALARLHTDGDLRRRLIAGGRSVLRSHHDPERQARGLIGAYERAIAIAGSKAPSAPPSRER